MQGSLSRRGFLAGTGAVIGSAALAGGNGGPIANVEQGQLRGLYEKGVRAFKGVPFAAPPIGAHRFLPPQQAKPWQGVKDATNFGPAPIQPQAPGGLSAKAFLGAETSEDCLYLNIWQPAEPGPHPVLVWVHGGGNMAGAASQGLDGSHFARAGIVCVTIGYRLGAFGFLELGDVLGSAYQGSGNNGLRDQIAALEWVQQNIAAFGGDAAQVTIGGVSAGAKNVVSLMAMAETQGLFSSVIVESGGQCFHDMRTAQKVADQFGRAANALAANDLLAADAQALNTAQLSLLQSYGRPFPFRAVVGSTLLPKPPLDMLRQENRTFRALIGSNRDEGITFLAGGENAPPLSQGNLTNIDASALPSVQKAYGEMFSNLSPFERKVRLLSAAEYGVPTYRLANALRAHGDIWLYRFAQKAGAGPFKGWAPHAYEGVFVWKMFDDPIMQRYFGPLDEAARALADEMHKRWCAFIKGDAPNVVGAANWPIYEGAQALVFAEDHAHVGTINQAEMNLWADIAF